MTSNDNIDKAMDAMLSGASVDEATKNLNQEEKQQILGNNTASVIREQLSGVAEVMEASTQEQPKILLG